MSMRGKLIIVLLFPSVVYSACFKNGYLETIDYWYYHHGARTCMEKLIIKPFESICNTDSKRKFHFIKKSTIDNEWRYFNYQDKVKDKIIFKDNVMIVNNNVIEGKTTTRNLNKSKAVELCNEDPITINENQCSTHDVNFVIQKQMIITLMDYIFSDYDKEDLFYQEVSIDSKIVDLAFELQRMQIIKKQKSISYHFKSFRKCGKYLVVNLTSYSAPKASSEKVFILKIIDNKLEVVKEEMLWIS